MFSRFLKLGTFLMIVLILVVSLMGYCEAKEKEYLIRIAYVLSEKQAAHIVLSEFVKPYLEEKSGGRIKVELYPNGVLGGDRQVAEAVQLGTVQMTIVTPAVLSGFEPRIQILTFPYLFRSWEQSEEAINGELGEKISNMFSPLGLKFLAFGGNGFRHISNNRRPITKVEDLKGLKIRTMENPIHIATFRALGANPTPMSYTELYSGLQQKTVDAQENPIALVYTSKFYEVQKYYTLDGHVFAFTVVLINDDFFSSLPIDLQELVKDAFQQYAVKQKALTRKQNEEMLVSLKNEGMQINELTPEQKQEFIKATQPVYEEFRDIIGEDLYKIALKIRKE